MRLRSQFWTQSPLYVVTDKDGSIYTTSSARPLVKNVSPTADAHFTKANILSWTALSTLAGALVLVTKELSRSGDRLNKKIWCSSIHWPPYPLVPISSLVII